MFVQEQGIVLSLRPFGDADYIVNFFGEKYGKQAGIAKSARSSRKRFGGLMTGTILDMQYRTRSYSEVVFFKEIQPALTHLEWRKEFDMMVCVMFALELAAKTLAEAQPAEVEGQDPVPHPYRPSLVPNVIICTKILRGSRCIATAR